MPVSHFRLVEPKNDDSFRVQWQKSARCSEYDIQLARNQQDSSIIISRIHDNQDLQFSFVPTSQFVLEQLGYYVVGTNCFVSLTNILESSHKSENQEIVFPLLLDVI